MKITKILLTDLKPDSKNENQHPEEMINILAKNIKQLGFDVPLVIDENNCILKGNGRYKALKKLGVKEVPCIIKTGLTEKQKTTLRISDNQLSTLSYWDNEKLIESLESLEPFEFELTGFNLNDIDDLKIQIDSFDGLDEVDEDKEINLSKYKDKKETLILKFDTEGELYSLINDLNFIRKTKKESYEKIIIQAIKKYKSLKVFD